MDEMHGQHMSCVSSRISNAKLLYTLLTEVQCNLVGVMCMLKIKSML